MVKRYNKLPEVSSNTFLSAISNLMNPSLVVVSWFHESKIGFGKSGSN